MPSCVCVVCVVEDDVMCSLSCALLNVHFLFCVVFFVPEFDREPCAYLFAPPKERQAGPRPQWSSSFTCSTKTEKRRRNKQSSKQSAVIFFFYPKHTNKSLTTLNNPNNPARKHKQQCPPTLPASAPCRRSDKVRPRQRTLEHSPQRLKKLYSVFCKKKRAKISWRNR